MKSQTRHRRIRLINFVLLTSIAFAFLGLLVSAAPDGFEMEAGAIKAGTYHPPVILVKATKTKDYYDAVDGPDKLDFSVKLRGQCDEKWRIQYAGMQIRGKDSKTVMAQVADGPDTRSIGPNHGQDWKVISFSVPYFSPVQSPVYLCNDRLKQAGDAAAQKRLLQEGFNIDVPQGFYASLALTCEHKGPVLADLHHLAAGAYVPAVVRCMPIVVTKGPPPREGRPLDFDPPITSVSATADPPVTSGKQCPVYVNFKGSITAGEKSQYTTFNTKFRFVGDGGYQGEWLPVSVSRGEPRSVHGRRFIQTPQNDPDSTLKMPGRTKIPLYHGWMALEVMLPEGVKRSDRANFTVDCNAPPPKIKAKP